MQNVCGIMLPYNIEMCRGLYFREIRERVEYWYAWKMENERWTVREETRECVLNNAIKTTGCGAVKETIRL